MDLLKRDGIKVEEISDYHMYPIADNDTPQLSADRFEYTFSNGMFLYGVLDLDMIKRFYEDIVILKNEDGIDELGFKTFEIVKEFVQTILPIFENYDSDNNRTVMQFFADIVKSMNVKGYITIDDLYELSEEDVINRILNCGDSYITDNFIKFRNAKETFSSDEELNDRYCISVKGKKRYIVPLVETEEGTTRINKLDEDVNTRVQDYLNLKRAKYTGFNFEFKPYEFEQK